MKLFLKNTLTRAVIYFTILTSIFALIILLVYSDNPEGANISALRTFLFLPFCIAFGAANTIITLETPGPAARWFLHGLLTVVSGYLCLILPATSDRKGSEKLVGFLSFLVVYVVLITVFIVFKGRIKTAREKESLYSDSASKR